MDDISSLKKSNVLKKKNTNILVGKEKILKPKNSFETTINLDNDIWSWSEFNKNDELQFTNFVKNNCKKYEIIKILKRDYNNGSFFHKNLGEICDDDESFKTNFDDVREKRLRKIIKHQSLNLFNILKDNNKHNYRDKIYHIKLNCSYNGLFDNETRLWFYKNETEKENQLFLFDPYHLALPSEHNGNTWDESMKKTYEKNKDNDVNYCHITN